MTPNIPPPSGPHSAADANQAPIVVRSLAAIPILPTPGTAPPSPLAPLLEELRAIVSRPIEDVACRDALLDCVARHRRLLGGAWYHAQGDQVIADAQRTPGGIFDRPEVKKWLTSTAARCLSEGHALVVDSPLIRQVTAVAVLARPNPAPADWSGPAPVHCLILVVPHQPTRSLDAEVLTAECVARAWSGWFEWRASRLAHERLRATAALVELLSQVASASTVREGSQIIATELQKLIECAFVAVCVVPPGHVTARFAAVSGLSDVDSFTPLVERIEAAANEGLLRGELTSFPRPSRSAEPLALAQRTAAETMRVESVVSVPLQDAKQQNIGMLVCGGPARILQGSSVTSLLLSSVTPVGAALAATRHVEGGWGKRFRRRLTQHQGAERRALWMAATLVAAIVLLYPAHYRARGRAVIEPVTRRFALAPYEGLVEDTFVEPGDEVAEGQLVARMDGRELRWELAGVIADEQRRAKERDVRLSARQVADSILSTLEMEQLAARRRLLEHRLANLEIVSPIRGIVLAGAVDQRRHFPVDKGHTLYEFAELDPVRMEIAIPASDLPHVKPGQTAHVQINGEGGSTRTGMITKIRPQSEIRDQVNVFVAEMEIANPDQRLRPGMEGSARVITSRRPLAWHWGHRLWERLLALLWW